MKGKQSLVLVLWGHYSDEIVAATSVVRLRQTGQRVKLVGLDRRKLSGAHGLTLVPDLTVGEALAVTGQVRSIVLTLELASLLRYLNDPRLVSLLQLAFDLGASLIAAQPANEESIQQLSHTLGRDVAGWLEVDHNHM